MHPAQTPQSRSTSRKHTALQHLPVRGSLDRADASRPRPTSEHPPGSACSARSLQLIPGPGPLRAEGCAFSGMSTLSLLQGFTLAVPSPLRTPPPGRYPLLAPAQLLSARGQTPPALEPTGPAGSLGRRQAPGRPLSLLCDRQLWSLPGSPGCPIPAPATAPSTRRAFTLQ